MRKKSQSLGSSHGSAATVTCSFGWASKEAYWFAGFAGGAFRGLSEAKEVTAKRQVVVTTRSGILGNKWDFMAKLIIIFAGAQGKAMPPHVLRRGTSDDCVQLAVAGSPGSGRAVLAAANGDQRAI